MTLNRSRISAFANKDVFDIVVLKHGSGWPAIHVKVKSWESYPNSDNEVLLTRDAQDLAEFELHIEELKLLLDDLKAKAQRKFAALAAQSERGNDKG